MKDICEIVKQLKWKYAGHLAREKREGGAKKCWTGNHIEKRKRGRPRTRWRDEIVREKGYFSIGRRDKRIHR